MNDSDGLLCAFFQKFGAEADAINVDENLLQLEITLFPTLQEMIEKMEPIEKLWKTAYKFDKCHEIWYVIDAFSVFLVCWFEIFSSFTLFPCTFMKHSKVFAVHSI